MVLVPKKGGGIRFAIDYRALNKEIDADAYTLPNMEEALSVKRHENRDTYLNRCPGCRLGRG